MGMKATHFIGSFMLVSGMGLMSGWAIQPGDPVAELIEELGEPVGFIDIAGSQVYMYDRGRVTVEDGKVTSAELISVEELAIRREAEALARARQAEALREKRLRRYQEGTRALAARLEDPAFMNASAGARLAYWKKFRVTYPEVTLPEDYELALRERDAERRAEQSEARLRELEERARVAELEAAAAAEAAEAAAQRASSYVFEDYGKYRYGYPTVIYTSPSRCTCRHARHGSCPVHRPQTYKSTYTPYRSTPGYGFQRPLSERPFGTGTGRKAFVPRTRAQINSHSHSGGAVNIRTDGHQIRGDIRLRL